MGLKDWLAKNVAGASGYGAAMGRAAVKNGLALGRVLYLGHGTRVTASDVFVFENSDQMKAEGFALYCADPTHVPPMEDSSALSKHTRAVGIAFASACTYTAASNFMKEANAKAFTDSSARSAGMEMHNSGLTPELLHYHSLPRPAGITKVLDLQKPGTNDLLAGLLEELSKQIPDRAVGFQRTGVLGFDVIAVSLVKETVKMVSAATQKFGW